MKKSYLYKILIVFVALILVTTQFYWIRKLYKDEYYSLKISVDGTFRKSFFDLQRKRLSQDSILISSFFDSPKSVIKNKSESLQNSSLEKSIINKVFEKTDTNRTSLIPNSKDGSFSVRVLSSENITAPPPELIEILIRRAQQNSESKQKIDTINGLRRVFFYDSSYNLNDGKASFKTSDPTNAPIIIVNDKQPSNNLVRNKIHIVANPKASKKNNTNQLFAFLRDSKALNDTIPLDEIDSVFKMAYHNSLKGIDYKIITKKWTIGDNRFIDTPSDTLNGFISSAIITGLNNPHSYQLLFPNLHLVILNKIKWQIGISFFLIMLILFTFYQMNVNLKTQQQLLIQKNDFISNITHELKTPISTVQVAIEALKSFNAINDKKRAEEYLNISKLELERLSLLVDKVLRISMFESKMINLNFEVIDCRYLIEEVLQSMAVQIEKVGATILVNMDENEYKILGDKLHLLSVIYNLIDNALKYSFDKPNVKVILRSDLKSIFLKISDEGIGISDRYKNKVFEKFFRIPSNDKHNVKGYGLGLSYVSKIVAQHKGEIQISDNIPKGTVISIILPRYEN